MTTSFHITEENFIDRFHPLPNHLDSNAAMDFGAGGCQFETFGDELVAVLASEPARVWTIMACGDEVWLASGPHVVNRMGYVLCEVSVDSGDSYKVRLD